MNKEELSTSQREIVQMCDHLRELLLDKNRRYGDSALAPVRIFSQADALEQIKVRIDDKISRIKSGVDGETEDVYMDLTGYFILLMIGLKRELAYANRTPNFASPYDPAQNCNLNQRFGPLPNLKSSFDSEMPPGNIQSFTRDFGASYGTSNVLP